MFTDEHTKEKHEQLRDQTVILVHDIIKTKENEKCVEKVCHEGMEYLRTCHNYRNFQDVVNRYNTMNGISSHIYQEANYDG